MKTIKLSIEYEELELLVEEELKEKEPCASAIIDMILDNIKGVE